MATKQVIEEFVRYYFKSLPPPYNQPEPRPIEPPNVCYVDIPGVVDELYEWLKLLPSTTKKEDIKSLVFKILRQSEMIANDLKTFKLNGNDVCIVCKKVIGKLPPI